MKLSSRHWTRLIVGGLGLVLVLLLLFHRSWATGSLAWNVTASVPRGLYWLTHQRDPSGWPAGRLGGASPVSSQAVGAAAWSSARRPAVDLSTRLSAPRTRTSLPGAGPAAGLDPGPGVWPVAGLDLGPGSWGSHPPTLARSVLLYVALPEPTATFATQRDYRQAPGWFLKHFAAGPGDLVCRDASGWSINGQSMGPCYTSDSRGRRLPHWQGCHRVPDGHIIVAGTHARSFDSRYYGPIPIHLVLAFAEPLWTF